MRTRRMQARAAPSKAPLGADMVSSRCAWPKRRVLVSQSTSLHTFYFVSQTESDYIGNCIFVFCTEPVPRTDRIM